MNHRYSADYTNLFSSQWRIHRNVICFQLEVLWLHIESIAYRDNAEEPLCKWIPSNKGESPFELALFQLFFVQLSVRFFFFFQLNKLKIEKQKSSKTIKIIYLFRIILQRAINRRDDLDCSKAQSVVVQLGKLSISVSVCVLCISIIKGLPIP